MEEIRRKILWGFLRNILIVCVLGVFSLLSGCAGKEDATPDSGRQRLVATTTMLADLARELGGEHVEVIGLMGPGIDPHLYQASAGDMASIQNADLLLCNGLQLEGKMGDIFTSMEKSGRTVICVEKGLDPALLLADEGNPAIYDPHVWFDASLWKDAASYTAGRMAEADPDNRADYEANLAAYISKLDELDRSIKNRVRELPENQRVLVTAHNAFRYFGRAYGFQVRGLQGISTDAEAGTSDVSGLAAYLAENRIKAVFVESSVPPKTIEALQAAVRAKGFDVAIGGQLYSDSLGDAGSDTETYLGTMTANIDVIVDALK